MWKKIEEHCHYPVEGRLVSRPRNKEACKWHKGDPLCEGCSYGRNNTRPKTEEADKGKAVSGVVGAGKSVPLLWESNG